MNILVLTNESASHKWRFDGIADRFHQNTSHEMYVRTFRNWNQQTLGADIVILEMLTNPDMVDVIHAQGAKVIYEADDAVIDSYGNERKNLQFMSDDFRGKAIETIAKCDMLTVTNWYLRNNYARFTDKPIHVLPNYMDFGWYGDERLYIPRNTDEIRLGWFGSRGHFEDLRDILPTIHRLLDKYPNLRFIYAGYGGMSSDKGVTEIGWGEDVFRELPRERREFVTGVQEDFWPMKHKLLDFDIGICPLIDDYFNHCKTPIKWMEYAANGVPAVCSNVVYGENPNSRRHSPVVRDGYNGLIAKTPKEWEEKLSFLIEDPDSRKAMGLIAKDDVQEKWNIDKHWRKWEKVYMEAMTL